MWIYIAHSRKKTFNALKIVLCWRSVQLCVTWTANALTVPPYTDAAAASAVVTDPHVMLRFPNFDFRMISVQFLDPNRDFNTIRF